MGVVGEIRPGVMELSSRVDANHKEICDRFDRQDAGIVAIKEILVVILSKRLGNHWCVPVGLHENV